jgi:hypothetical protein
MKSQRLTVVLTVVNLVLLVVLFSQFRTAAAQAEPGLLRGRGLEIVDAQKRVRAQIILTDDAAKAGQPERDGGVLLRLIGPNGRPSIKMGASVDGTGVSLAGDPDNRDWDGIQILAKGSGSMIKITNKDGKVGIVKP